MKDKIQIFMLRVLLVILIIMLATGTKVFASTLVIRIDTDKDVYKVNEEIKTSVSWSENMQAAGFTLNYDSSKLEFVSASIGSSFYNSDTDGVIKVNWASFDEKDAKNIDFTFKAKAEGTGEFIRISEPRAFSTGNLVVPTDYNITNEGTKILTIESEKPQGEDPQGEEPQSENPQGEKPQGEEPQNVEPQNNKPSSGQIENTTNPNTNSNVSTRKLPNTGIKNVVLISAFIMSALSIVFYSKYKKMSGI